MSQRRINFAVNISFSPKTAKVCFEGDGTSSPLDLEHQLREIVSHHPAQVMLDLSNLNHLSSIGLGTILSLRRAVVSYGGEITLESAQSAVLDVLRRTGVDVLFIPNYPDSGPDPETAARAAAQ